MSGFFDEFDEFVVPIKPETPTQYKKLEDTKLRGRDLDTFDEPVVKIAMDKYELISFLDKELLSGGWTKKNLEPLLNKFFQIKVGSNLVGVQSFVGGKSTLKAMVT